MSYFVFTEQQKARIANASFNFGNKPFKAIYYNGNLIVDEVEYDYDLNVLGLYNYNKTILKFCDPNDDAWLDFSNATVIADYIRCPINQTKETDIKYGCKCRVCGMYDAYATQESDGMGLCYIHSYKE